MRIGHFSDLHGDVARIDASARPDLWVCTGDFFPNMTRGDRSVEVPYQEAWFTLVWNKLIERLGGMPLIWVGGNHDYVSLAQLLQEHGYEGPVWDATEAPVEFEGQVFFGYREIPWIEGEWNGETMDLRPMVRRVIEVSPTILLTHAPPCNVLDDLAHRGRGIGASALTTALCYQPHRITHHLFGHVHQHGGKNVEEMGIQFYNGALGCRIIEI